MTTLPIVWQRLLSPEGKTCVRCDGTHQEMLRAMDTLRASLRPLGIEPVLEIKQIDDASFKANPSESNRIWVGGKSLEEWVGGSVGSSPCCSVCGDSPCRTVEVEGTTFEVVPEALVRRAASLAASQILTGPSDVLVPQRGERYPAPVLAHMDSEKRK
jgi:hypothetical protein